MRARPNRAEGPRPSTRPPGAVRLYKATGRACDALDMTTTETTTEANPQNDNQVRVGGSLLRVTLIVLIVGLLLVGFALLRDRHHGVSIPAGATRVDATLSDYHIAITPAPLAHGKSAFVVHN